MSAAVASLPLPHQNSPRFVTALSLHTSSNVASSSSSSTSRMGAKSRSNSPRHVLKTEDPPNALATKTKSERDIKQDTVARAAGGDAAAAATAAPPPPAQPLAPPPRPVAPIVGDTPDYFSSIHHSSQLALEPNPFEQSFGNSTAETPGKSLLPPVAALASPASLLPGPGSSAGFNWSNSLRSGPLSPAMLTGPTGPGDYFDSQIRASFPTPNESSLRTGLTPGGGGTMFPAPSPNSQALFQQLAASGAATPGTLDFHRTAMNAAAARRSDSAFAPSAMAARRQSEAPVAAGLDDSSTTNRVSTVSGAAAATAPTVAVTTAASSTSTSTTTAVTAPADAPSAVDPFGAHDANDAANGLFLLARARDGSHSRHAPPPPRFPQDRRAPAVTAVSSHSVSSSAAPTAIVAPVMTPAVDSPDPSPTQAQRPVRPPAGGSLRGSLSGSVTGLSEMSGEFSEDASEQPRPNGRTKTRRPPAVTAKTGPSATTARRKADDSSTGRGSANKRSKGLGGAATHHSSASITTLSASAFRPSESGDDDDIIMADVGGKENSRKMTDEEKRKNFLERNRVAALKCRQRKKQWLANLQAKVEIFSSENDALSAQVTQLREEIVNLKTLLLAHKDCPISQAQGLSSMNMNGLAADYPGHGHGHGHANPYSMAIAPSVMAARGVPRR